MHTGCEKQQCTLPSSPQGNIGSSLVIFGNKKIRPMMFPTIIPCTFLCFLNRPLLTQGKALNLKSLNSRKCVHPLRFVMVCYFICVVVSGRLRTNTSTRSALVRGNSVLKVGFQLVVIRLYWYFSRACISFVVVSSFGSR